VLFSDPATAQLMNATFECAWSAVAPVPRATIDFGNGHVLDRTLAGNVLTWICTPDGVAVHALPGLFTPQRYAALLRESAELAGRSKDEDDGAVAAFHAAKLQSPALRFAALDAYPDVSKGFVEDPLKNVFHLMPAAAVPALPAPPSGPSDLSKVRVEAPIKRSAALPTGHGGAATSAPDRSKRIVESAIEWRTDLVPPGSRQPAPTASTAGDMDTLAADSAFNDAYRLPQVHALFLEHARPTPSTLTRRVYREILHVDLDDPYLGLAPRALGGEIGRR